jgi:hypothetical protein
MRHIRLYENFGQEETGLDITDKNSLDIGSLTLTVWYDREHWDNDDDYEKDVTYAAENQNDSMTEELDRALYQHGLAIDDSEEHPYDLEDGWVDYQLKKISHAEMANDPEGVKALQDKGYTEEEIAVLRTASKYGIG